VPDKSLYRLPFAALFSKSKNKYLIEEQAISYAPSSSIFVIASENARQKESLADESLLSVGNPRFDAAENPNLSDLPAAETEAKKIAEFYRSKRQLIGAEATKTNVLNGLTSANVFHFAGHYVTNEASAPNSKLLLTNGDWRLSELAEKRLPNAKLVVLSACQTNAEKVFQGEGAVGIARAFLATGAPLVLASGWKVESESAKDLMIAFHRNRKEKGLRSAEALRAAQIEMLKSENVRFRAPYFWSAFSLVGGFTNY
jgi:CHAT domain-containing protein